MIKLALALSVVLFAPLFAMATPDQGSITFDCGNNKMSQFNLEGVTFMPNQLAAQGYTVKVENNVASLEHGNDHVAFGFLQKPGQCSYSSGTYTDFIYFTNANLNITKTTKHLSDCIEVTTDGMWGIKNAYTLDILATDSDVNMTLKQEYMDIYQSLEQCQEALQQ